MTSSGVSSRASPSLPNDFPRSASAVARAEKRSLSIASLSACSTEIRRQSHALNHPEFVFDLAPMCLARKDRFAPVRSLRSPTLLCPLNHESLEIFVGGHTRGQRKGWQRRLQLFHPKRAPFGNCQRGGYPFRRMLPTPTDLRRALE